MSERGADPAIAQDGEHPGRGMRERPEFLPQEPKDEVLAGDDQPGEDTPEFDAKERTLRLEMVPKAA